MSQVKIENRVIPVEGEDGFTKYVPAIKFGDGDYNLISHQGRVLLYDTIEEALEYFED